MVANIQYMPTLERERHVPQLFRSTRGEGSGVSLRKAILQGQPPEGGLYMPQHLDKMSPEFIRDLPDLSLQDIATQVSSHFFSGAISEKELRKISETAFNFPIEMPRLEKKTHLLELFHGPTAAFKDFGARFMSQLLARELKKPNGDERPLTILVATSGDTGSAVASSFLNIPGIRVTILFPYGRVSELQERQLTTYGEDSNIWTLEVDGTFGDCQAMVKMAMQDPDLKEPVRLTSANSINIARLLPQSFYYFWAYGQLQARGYKGDVVFSVPSGNFGNLTAGILAKRMGLPVKHFIAATNLNNIVPEYLATGVWRERTQVDTNSPSMDVNDPSNFDRLKDLYGGSYKKMRREIRGTYFDEGEKNAAIKRVWKKRDYLMDPHSVIAYLGLREYREVTGFEGRGVVLMTAHPAKFADTVEGIIKEPVETPHTIQQVKKKKKDSTQMSAEYQDFRAFLEDNKDRL